MLNLFLTQKNFFPWNIGGFYWVFLKSLSRGGGAHVQNSIHQLILFSCFVCSPRTIVFSDANNKRGVKQPGILETGFQGLYPSVLNKPSPRSG